VIDGASAYDSAALYAVYRDQLGRPITSASAQAIVAQIEAMYVRDGYSRPEFRLDADLAANGILRIEVFEPLITEVSFIGDSGPYAQRLSELAEDVRGRAPLKSSELQGALRKMRELPGLNIRASTRRDESRRNAYALDIETDFKPLDGVIEATNRGTDEIGPFFVVGQLASNNLFRQEERMGLLFSAATDEEEFFGAGAFFDLPTGDSGTHLSGTYFTSKSNPTEKIDRDDRFLRDRASVRVTQPLEFWSRAKIALSAGLDFDDLDLFREDLRLRDERLRVFEIGARMNGSIGSSQYLLAMQVRQGLNLFGAQLEALDLRYDPRRQDFLSVRMQYTQLVRVADRWLLRIDALGQQSGYVLPDAERYKIGGERLGRGFEVTEIAGDQGLGAKLELRRDLGSPVDVVTKSSVYGFYDIGAAWKQDLPGGESAASLGMGMSIEAGRVFGFIEVAKPLTHADVEGKRDTKVFGELSLRF
jgi:hemolysin activation/secretion protein